MIDEIDKLSRWIESSSTRGDATGLLNWSRNMIDKIERGDLMIGILPVDQAKLVPMALEKALSLGLGEAGIPLADWLARTPIGKPDIPAAEKVLLHTIELGVGQACIPLMHYRWFYRRNECSESEAKQAFLMLEQWQTKLPNDHAALYLLGLVTCHGFGTTPDPEKSAHLLRQSAELGNADAMFELFIYHANRMGVAPDEVKAAEYLLQAGEAGQIRAMYNLGAFHATGRFFPKNMVTAIEWYTSAAEAGHERAASTLAEMYENGLGVDHNQELAQRFRNLAGE